jgi:MoaA/NifB/PqqE/SkfB family radical SAM enzyme
MKTTDLLRAWKNILTGRPPCLSIEITKECPLTCPGCYAYNDEHLGGGMLLRQVSDFKGQELIDRFMQIIDHYRPVHVSIVGGEPLVRFRELGAILPQLEARQIRTHVVTSAVRPIPKEWAKFESLTIPVSIDGLPAEHDVRRKPATYERILKNIEGHQIAVHCTITRQMTHRPGYMAEFLDFWSAQKETQKIWISLFTPQVGETSYEVLTPELRARVIQELSELRLRYPKLAMPKSMIDALQKPPSDPEHCIFARITPNITADLKTRVTPCQFGGKPDCSQCGCAASAGLHAVGNHRLPGGIPLSRLYEASFKVGSVVGAIRGGS